MNAVRRKHNPLRHFQTGSRRASIMEGSSGEPARKRQRLGHEDYKTNPGDLHSSLTGSISPPPLRRARLTPKLIPSPFQLTSIRDLPASLNVDAVSLEDILGDPLIAECWEFNYLHDLDFLMSAFDDDVRDLVKVHVIHGFWKNEDTSRLFLKVNFLTF
jgi:tyrosyl-DNA phosphodiesterase-1